MKLSNQASGALLMALQKCLMEQSDITGILKDMDFEVELARALSVGPMKTSNNDHITLASKNLPGKVQYRKPLHPSMDGNTVELAVEQTEFAENAMRYQTTLNFINSKLSGLISAIRGE